MKNAYSLHHRLNEFEREFGAPLSHSELSDYFKSGWEVDSVKDIKLASGVLTIYRLLSGHGDTNYEYKPIKTTDSWQRKDGRWYSPDSRSSIVIDYSLPIMRLGMEPSDQFAAGFPPYEISSDKQRKYFPLVRVRELEDVKTRVSEHRRDITEGVYGRTIQFPTGNRVFTSPSIKNPHFITPITLYNSGVKDYQDKFIDLIFDDWLEKTFK